MFRLFLIAAMLFNPSQSLLQGQEKKAVSVSGTATLTVTVTGLRNSNGQVFVQLWNDAAGFPKDSAKASKYIAIDGTKILGGTAVATFPDLAPGRYAVSVLHDENRNGKMDNNMLGMPKEGWAVSNNIVTHTHAPSFEQASFEAAPGGQKLTIAVHY